MSVRRHRNQDHETSQTLLKQEAGFTMVEVVVVIGVVALLAGILVPLISKNLEDAKGARVKAELRVMAAAIGSFYKDTSHWPIYADGRNLSNQVNRLETAKGTLPAKGRGATKWLQGRKDSLENQLIQNQPSGSKAKAYSTSGEFGWRGPYLPELKADPWGKKYLALILPGRIILLSAGPNRTIDTPPDQREAQGDDVLFALSMHGNTGVITSSSSGSSGGSGGSGGSGSSDDDSNNGDDDDQQAFVFDLSPGKLGPRKPGAKAGVTVTGFYKPGSSVNLLEDKPKLKTTNSHYYFEGWVGESGYNYLGGHDWFKNNNIKTSSLKGSVVTFSDGTTGVIDVAYDGVKRGSKPPESAYIYYKAYDLEKKKV